MAPLVSPLDFLICSRLGVSPVYLSEYVTRPRPNEDTASREGLAMRVGTLVRLYCMPSRPARPACILRMYVEDSPHACVREPKRPRSLASPLCSRHWRVRRAVTRRRYRARRARPRRWRAPHAQQARCAGHVGSWPSRGRQRQRRRARGAGATRGRTHAR